MNAQPVMAIHRWRSTLEQLGNRLARLGYGEFCASFNPLAPRGEGWYAKRDEAPADIRHLIDLFLLGQVVPSATVEELLGDETTRVLVEVGILAQGPQGLATRGLLLLPVLGTWLFAQRFQMNPTLYLGDDSLALMARLLPRRDGRVLDLCAGPGLQALFSSRFAREVTAVELNPVAASLATINSIINGRADVMRVRCGNLYAPVQGERFDTITANPPLLPLPEDLDYPFVGHGGPDGMQVTWKILDGLDAALTPEGYAQIIGTFLSDGIAPLCVEPLQQWSKRANMSVLMSVVSHHELSDGSPYFEGLVETAVASMGGDREQARNSMRRFLKAQKATHLCAGFLHVHRGTRSGFHLQDVSNEGTNSLWYV